ncbi:hypothetical protein R8Z50_18305 [Longispora sp. K20-0274]|uniref:hypothetical protein n=1 Tax=Longispora sp. K20-0274 TaxID=3088255 RepID=UPI00399B6CB6
MTPAAPDPAAPPAVTAGPAAASATTAAPDPAVTPALTAAPDPAGARPVVRPDSRVGLPELSIVPDGDEYVVGDPVTGQFVSLPGIGVVAVRALAADVTIAEAAVPVSAAAGEDVNLVEFVATLLECGLVRSLDGVLVGPAAPAGESRWLARIRPERARLLFGPVAWTLYAGALCWSVGVWLVDAQYRPALEDVLFYPDPLVCMAVLFPVATALAMAHELWHWLAARALGVGARISTGRRAFFFVLQTDLAALWSLPRRRRLGPLAAGVAFDSLVLGMCLAVRVAGARWGIAPLLDRFLAAIVLRQAIVIGWQLLVCVRTDGYLLISTALGCRNLLDTARLHVRSRLWRLTPAQAATLAGTPRHERRVAAWYGPLLVVGVAFLALLFVNYWVPAMAISGAWIGWGIAGAPWGSRAFWEAAVPALVMLVQFLAPAAVVVRDRRRARRAR